MHYCKVETEMRPHKDKNVAQVHRIKSWAHFAVVKSLEAWLNSTHRLECATLEWHQELAVSSSAFWEDANRVEA